MVNISNVDIFDMVIRIIENRPINSILPLEELINDSIALLKTDMSDDEIEEESSRKVNSIRRMINSYLVDLEKQNISSFFEWNLPPSTAPDLIRKKLDLRLHDEEYLYPSKKLLDRRIREFIADEISDSQFEDLCKMMAEKCLGYPIAIRTGKKDEGIDVMSKILIGTTNNPVLVVVQSKRYTVRLPIGVEIVRAFYGAIDIMIRFQGKTGNHEPAKKAETLNIKIKPLQPIIPYLMVTSRFSIDSKRLADKLGILLLDGLDIANMLIDQNIGYEVINNEYVFSRRTVLNFIQ